MAADLVDSSADGPEPESLAVEVALDTRGCLKDALVQVRKSVLNCCLFTLFQFAILAAIFATVGQALTQQGSYPLWQRGLATLLASLLGLAITNTGLLVLAWLPVELSDTEILVSKSTAEPWKPPTS